MTTKTKDPDQQAVYYSEQIVFEGTLFAEQLHSDGLLHLADELFHSEWWSRNRIPVPKIEPTTSKDTSSCAIMWVNVHSGDSRHVIRMAPTQLDPWTLAHEAAHVAQCYLYNVNRNPDLETHGREFRACYLNVAEILLGRNARDDLETNFNRRLPIRPEHAHGMPGSILTVPRVKPGDVDQAGYGIFKMWHMVTRAEEFERARQRAIAFSVDSQPMVNGAFAL